MTHRIRRRDVLTTGAALGTALSLGDLSFLQGLPPVSAEEAQVDPNVVRLDPHIEPLVRLLETTPRDKLLEQVAQRIRKGLSYREVLAALLLAGVRNVEPRPSVGFKFHAVLVVNSAHLASVSGPPEHRWLPIFWALDYYKSAEARDTRERGWTMPPVDESKVPPPHKARQMFIDAMENWDESQADAAVASLARSAGGNELYELMFRYGARDFRSIGHKAIFVANSWRTLQCIGWQHAEPIVRSLAYAMLMHEGGNPAKREDEADLPFRRNQELAKKIPATWLAGKLDDGATQELLQTLRTGSPNEACDQVVELLNGGIHPQSIWDALFVESGEMLMRQPGIIALHSVTTSNAVRFAYQMSGNDETRRLLLLQNAAFLPMFRERMRGRGRVRDTTIEALKPLPPEAKGAAAVEEIFSQLGRESDQAAAKALAFLNETARPQELIDAARVLIFKKGDDAHDYKFSSAVLEDYYHVSPNWRNQYLAANMYKLIGSTARDNGLVQRTRAALS